MIRTPDIETCQELLERMPVAICRVDAQDVIQWANPAFAEMLGWDSGPEIVGCPVERLFVSSDEMAGLLMPTKRDGSVTQEFVRLVKRDREILFALASTLKLADASGRYDGWVAILTRAGIEKYDEWILDNVPAGIYEVRSTNGREALFYCNRGFAEMFEFGSEREACGHDIREFYRREDDYQAFLDQLDAQDPLLEHRERLKTYRGKDLNVLVSAVTIKDHSDRVIGRIGIVQKITQERMLQERMDDLRTDIGRVFHAYSSALVKIGHAVRSATFSMEPAPFEAEERPSTDQVNEALAAPAAHLRDALEGLMALIEADWAERGLLQKQWDNLSRLAALFREYRKRISVPEFRLDTLRRGAHSVVELAGNLPRGRLPDEPLKRVERTARDVERIACLALLRQAESEILDMEHQVQALRSYVTSGTRPPSERTIVEIWSLVRLALDGLAEYAQTRDIEYDLRNDSRRARVRVVEGDVLRALSNILHNAIKYSWSREKGKRPWITVRAFVRDHRVSVEFENYGVPIPKDEIEQGLIFQLGYRGRLSGDRGRLGTGIGLADARMTAQHHGGNVEVRSRPAWRHVEPDDYTVPYITTVTLWLPVCSQ